MKVAPWPPRPRRRAACGTAGILAVADNFRYPHRYRSLAWKALQLIGVYKRLIIGVRAAGQYDGQYFLSFEIDLVCRSHVVVFDAITTPFPHTMLHADVSPTVRKASPRRPNNLRQSRRAGRDWPYKPTIHLRGPDNAFWGCFGANPVTKSKHIKSNPRHANLSKWRSNLAEILFIKTSEASDRVC